MTPFNEAARRVAESPEDYRPWTVRQSLWMDAVNSIADNMNDDDHEADDLRYDGRDHNFADGEASSTNAFNWYQSHEDPDFWIEEALANFGTEGVLDGGGRIITRLQELGVYMEASAAWSEAAEVIDALAAEIEDDAEEEAA